MSTTFPKPVVAVDPKASLHRFDEMSREGGARPGRRLSSLATASVHRFDEVSGE